MANRGMKSKRRWIQWVNGVVAAASVLSAVAIKIAPAVAVALPEYALPATLGATALTALNFELARRSKNAQEKEDVSDK